MMTHDLYGRTIQYTNGTLTHRITLNDTPHPDGALQNVVRHYRHLFTVNTSGHVCDEFVRLISLHVNLETSTLVGELHEESEEFLCLHSTCLTNLRKVL
jgi:hypothetical protein